MYFTDLEVASSAMYFFFHYSVFPFSEKKLLFKKIIHSIDLSICPSGKKNKSELVWNKLLSCVLLTLLRAMSQRIQVFKVCKLIQIY